MTTTKDRMELARMDIQRECFDIKEALRKTSVLFEVAEVVLCSLEKIERQADKLVYPEEKP